METAPAAICLQRPELNLQPGGADHPVPIDLKRRQSRAFSCATEIFLFSGSTALYRE